MIIAQKVILPVLLGLLILKVICSLSNRKARLDYAEERLQRAIDKKENLDLKIATLQKQLEDLRREE